MPFHASFRAPGFPSGVLPPWIDDFVQAVAEDVQVCRSMVAALVLTALSIALQKKFVVVVRPRWVEQLGTFVLVVAKPSERKSPVYSRVMDPIVAFEVSEAERLREDILRSHARGAALKRRAEELQRKASRASDDDVSEAIRLVEAAVLEAESYRPLVPPRLTTGDVTTERLEVLVMEHDGRMAIVSTEPGIFGVMTGRYQSGTPNFDIYLKGYSGDDHCVDRIGRAGGKIRNPCLTMGLCAQLGVLSDLGSKKSMGDRGLLARFFYFVPHSKVGRRDTDAPPAPQHVVDAYRVGMTQLLELHAPTGLCALQTETLTLSLGASDMHRAFRADLEPRLGEGGDLGDDRISSWAGKLAGGVARIAALIHVASQVHPGTGGQLTLEYLDFEVSAEAMESAITIARECLIPHARLAFGRMGESQRMATARYVWGRIRTSGKGELTARDVFELVKGRVDTMEELKPLIEALEDLGYLRQRAPDSEGSVGRGRRPSPRYLVNPLARSIRTNSGNAGDRGPWDPSANTANSANVPDEDPAGHSDREEGS